MWLMTSCPIYVLVGCNTSLYKAIEGVKTKHTMVLTLSCTTRRVASSKGNFSKEDAVLGNQFPILKKSNNLSIARPPSIESFSASVEKIFREWNESGGEKIFDISQNEEEWMDIISLVESVYEPVFSKSLKPDKLADKTCLTAAAFAALASAVDEKLTILSGSDGSVLQRTTKVMKKDPKKIAESLLNNEKWTSILLDRLKTAKKLLSRRGALKSAERVEVLHRLNKLKEAPLPHHPSLFDNFSGGKTSAVSAGTVIASDMHFKLVEHIFKVSFRKWGPCGDKTESGEEEDEEEEEEEKKHSISRFVLQFMNGHNGQHYHRPESASVYFCDYYDYLAYRNLPNEYKLSSMHPGTFNMEDLPFRPFAVPSTYKTELEYKRFVQSTNLPQLSFDYGEFLCYCIFGADWYKHLGDVVDSLENSSMISFDSQTLSGVYKNTANYKRLGKKRNGIADLAVRSMAEFIRTEAHKALTAEEMEEEEEEEEAEEEAMDQEPAEVDFLSVPHLRRKIRQAVSVLNNFVENDLSILVSNFKNVLTDDTVSGTDTDNFGSSGEFEALSSHLFLSRILDEVHILRNTDIQRTLFSTHVSLSDKSPPSRVRGSNVNFNNNAGNISSLQTYGGIEELPENVLVGLSGGFEDTDMYSGEDVVVVWDGCDGGKVLSVTFNCGDNFIQLHEKTAETFKDDTDLVERIRDVLQTASKTGNLNKKAYSRKNIYAVLRENGIERPGDDFTEKGIALKDKTNQPPPPARSAKITVEGVKGFFSGFRDILETRALTTYSAETFRDLGQGIVKETEGLTAATVAETSFSEGLAESLRSDANLGLEFSEDAKTVVFKNDTSRSLLEETRALRANNTSFSSFARDMGVQVSADLDAEFAAEMRETYPDAALEQNLKDLDKFEETIPESQVKKLKKIDSYLTENPERAGKEINDTELSKATDSVLGKKLGNAVTVLMNNFGKVTIVVGASVVAGFLGPAAVALVHASRGAHLNVVDHTSPKGVISYKIVDFSCADRNTGWAKPTKHPFREEIDHVIALDASFLTENGAYVFPEDGGPKSKYKAYAPICGTKDAAQGECGSWATFDDPHSVLPWVASMKDLPKGQSLSCDKGMSTLKAVSSVLLSIGKDVAEAIFEVAEDAVVGLASKAISAVINNPLFIFGVPLGFGIAATRLNPSNWKTGLIVFSILLVVILIVRFFAGSGPLTLNWFGAKNSAKRKQTEQFEDGGGNRSKIVLAEKDNANSKLQSRRNETGPMRLEELPGHEDLRPVFFPATTNYSKSAKILGYKSKPFNDFYTKIINTDIIKMDR
ncbi:ORF36 [White spot syndrome virus]|uniref:Wsv011 n=5 Tax=White spot syndrome virus TaxID=342409 RepID=Q77JA4_WSSVS